jgi:NhaP-type Na+/H+ or K+/H+ antiporter
MMPWLFSSIGASLQLKLITPQSVAFSISHIFLGQFFRFLAVLLLTGSEKGKFTWRERLFIAISYIPKSNTTATISGLYLSEAK